MLYSDENIPKDPLSAFPRDPAQGPDPLQELLRSLPGGAAVFRMAERPQCLYYNGWPQNPVAFCREELQHFLEQDDFIARLIVPADAALFRREVLERAERGLPVNAVFRYLKYSGGSPAGFGWLHMTATKIREDGGAPIYCALLTTPPEETQLYRSIVEDSLTAALIYDPATESILLANAAFYGLFSGIRAKSSVAAPLSSVVFPQDAAMLRRQAELLPAQGYRDDTVVISGERTLLVRGKRLFWNRTPVCMFYVSDLTAVEKQNRELGATLNRIPGGIGIYSVQAEQLDMLYLNEGFFTMLHDTPENLENYRGDRVLSAIHPTDLPLFADALARIRGGADTVDLTYRVRNTRGEYLWFRLLGNTVRRAGEAVFLYCSFFDVSDQMQAQITLNNDRLFLDLAIQNAHMLPWEYHYLRKQIVQSEYCQRATGLPRTMENVPQSLIENRFVHPDCAENYRAFFLAVPNPAHPTEQTEVRVLAADGSCYIWKRMILTHLFDSEGHYLKSVGTSFEITRQKEAESDYYRQQQELLGTDSPNLMVKARVNLTHSRNELYIAKSAEVDPALRTAAHDSIVERLIALALQPEQKQELRTVFNRSNLLAEFRRGKTFFSCEYQRRRAAGTPIWVRMNCSLFAEPNTGDVIAFIYTYDITDEKLSQELIRTVVHLDYDYFALLNAAENSFVVYEGVRNNSSPLPPPHGADYEISVAEYARAYLIAEDQEQNIHDMSIANIREQLRDKNLFCSYARIIGMDGSVRRKKLQFSYIDRSSERVLITRADVTEVFEQEQQRLLALQAAADAAKRANDVKTDFLSRMSHDLRTPMNAIIGLSELAKDEQADPAALLGYISGIRSAANFLLQLVNDCLDYERISAERLELHPVPYPYAEFRSDIMNMLSPLCRQKNLAFVFGETAVYTVSVDRVRFEQIFFNLLSNAVKFTPPGGRVEFLTDACRKGELLCCDFTVRDNGIGMSEAFQAHMFEPFVQESSEILPQPQGSGLGLAIVKNLVELMHGTIAVKSAPGAGSTFLVHLDLPLYTAPAPLPAAGGAQESLAGMHVLLAEDNLLNTRIAQKLLEKSDAAVTCAENGRRAVELFSAAAPGEYQAILMDIRMPVMNGLEAARAIRALPGGRDIPIIAMTANAFEEDVRATRDAGMNAHLCKPIDPELLCATLAQLWKK